MYVYVVERGIGLSSTFLFPPPAALLTYPPLHPNPCVFRRRIFLLMSGHQVAIVYLSLLVGVWPPREYNELIEYNAVPQ